MIVQVEPDGVLGFPVIGVDLEDDRVGRDLKRGEKCRVRHRQLRENLLGEHGEALVKVIHIRGLVDDNGERLCGRD